MGALLSLAAYQADAKGGGEQGATNNTVAASLQNISASHRQPTKRPQSTEEDETKCGPEQYGSHADLCAQWKAADAATDSAWWAWVSGLVGFGSGQTPAYDLEHGGDFLVITGDPRQFDPDADGRLAQLNPARHGCSIPEG